MRTITSALLTVLFGIYLVACNAAGTADDKMLYSENDVNRDFEQGLTVIDVQVDRAIKVAFSKGENVIIIEAVRGNVTPDQYQKDPAAPRYEIDARITDKEGRLLYLRRGGDNFVDAAWEDDLLWQDNMAPLPEGNSHLFDMVSEAAELLEDALRAELGDDVAAKMVHEVNAVKVFSNATLATLAATEEELSQKLDNDGVEQLPAIAGGGGSSSGSEDGAKSLTRGYYMISLHTKTGGVWPVNYYHSATRIHKYNAGSYTYFDFCNHGTCAGDMSQHCSISMISKPDWTAYTCTTDYSSLSNDGHNCHDDSRVQMAAFVYGVPNNGSQYWCNDGDSSTDFSSGNEYGRPSCTNDNNSGYDHPSMYVYSEVSTSSATVNTTTYNVVLSANVTYQISTCGSTSTDTYLRLKTGATQVAYNDDACGLQSTITYTPSVTGTYTIHAGCFSNNSCSGKININQVSSTESPRFYSATNTNSAQQNTVNYSVYLSAGNTYEISTCGNSSTDTYLRLNDASGGQVTYNDDACGLQSKMTYTPSVSATYTIKSGCYGSGTCNGTVVVTQL